MPYTTTHVLVGIILIELFRDYFIGDARKFPRYYILIMAIASVFPDFEYLFQLQHLNRGILHSLITPLIFLLIGIFALKLNIKNKKIGKWHLKLSSIFFIFSAGTFIHIFLDSTLRNGAMLFYPFSNIVIGLNLISLTPISESVTLIAIDTALLFLWIFWMEFKLKITNYF